MSCASHSPQYQAEICLVKMCCLNEQRVQPCLERCFLPPAPDFLYVGVHCLCMCLGTGRVKPHRVFPQKWLYKSIS